MNIALKFLQSFIKFLLYSLCSFCLFCLFRLFCFCLFFSIPFRNVTFITLAPPSTGDAEKLSLIQTYKRKIETELEDICSDILEIIKNELIPNTESEEGKVFYYKMKVLCSLSLSSPRSAYM